MLVLREARCFAEGVLHLRDGVVESIVMHGLGVDGAQASVALDALIHSFLFSHDKFI